MKIVFRAVLAAVIAGLGIWLWTWLFPGPEKVIHRRLEKLARTASFSGGESDLARLAAARNLAGFFSTNVELNLDTPRFGHRDIMDREEITQAAVAIRMRSQGMKVNFPDITVTLAPDRQSAIADVTVQADIPGDTDNLVQEMKFTLRRIDGEWLITRIETVRTLSLRPQNGPEVRSFRSET